MDVVLILIALVLLVIGFIGAMKSIKRKEKHLSKKTATSILIGIILIFVVVVNDPNSEKNEADKEEPVSAEDETTDKESDTNNEETPEERLAGVLEEVIDSERIEDITHFDGHTTLKIKASDNLTTNMIRKSMLLDATEILNELKIANHEGTTLILFMFPMTDKYGEEKDMKVMSLEVSPETLEKINFDNFNRDNLSNIADDYYEHPALNQ